MHLFLGGIKELALARFPSSGTGELTVDIVRAHGVVLVTGSYCQDKAFLDKWGEFCHNENIGFVACNTFGGTGFCFTDFGEKWETFDETGEPGLMRGITGIFNSETIDEVIAEESAFVSKFEKELDELKSSEGDNDENKNKYNTLMEQLQQIRFKKEQVNSSIVKRRRYDLKY